MANVDLRSNTEYLNATKKVLTNSGLGNTKVGGIEINSVFNAVQNPTNIATDGIQQLGDATGLSNSKVGSLVVGLAQGIISAILSGDMSAPKGEIKDANQSVTDIQNLSTQGQQTGDATHSQAAQIQGTAQSQMDDSKESITESGEKINNGAKTLKDTIDENNKTYQENQDKINENNEQIRQKQEELDNINSQIAMLTATQGLKIPSVQDNQNQGNGKDKNNPISNLAPANSNGNANNSEVQALIAKGAVLTGELVNLKVSNNALAGDMKTSNDGTRQAVDDTSETNAAEANNIDAQADQLLSTINDAKDSVTELTNLAKGELLPKFDTQMTKRIGQIAGKAVVNGTNSGTLAALAATFGVGSVFSMGATAMKAKNATEGSIKYGTASALDVAKAAMEKQLQTAFQNYMRQNVIAPLNDITGGIAGDMFDLANSTINDVKSGTDNTYTADASNSKVDDTKADLDEKDKTIDNLLADGGDNNKKDENAPAAA